MARNRPGGRSAAASGGSPRRRKGPGGRMTDQIIDVGAIRPGATARSPELSLPERWSTPPQLGIEVLATPVDSPDGPVASVSVVTPQLVIEGAETWRSKASDLAHRGWTALHR